MKFNPLSTSLFLSGAHAFGGIGMGFGGGQTPGINLGFGGGLIPGFNFGIGGGQFPGLGIGFGGTQIPGFNFGGLPLLPGQGNGSPGTSPGTNFTSTQHYTSVCPQFHGRELEINPGYKAVLYCGVYGEHNQKRLGAKSLERCAQLCEDEDGCIGSTWLSQKSNVS
ncbi:hypothetical protein BS50DRAFT_628817 [Corynespora cassiicola Philippines]|uniref:Apple domain-containing protein n=1 Tax=Corynespora cassiicola Philippines TaxID=1448308 RepID=A0A2T2PDG1_CORCC|nr:hypothetical protein BS50DRAFT_628817 [Corynespora cassiicola Philippines]